MSAPLFVLCVGAQKAGTTWLHHYIAGSPAAAATPMKEFHVWNSLYPSPGEVPVQFEGTAAGERHRFHRELVADPERYFDYFADRLAEPGKRIACDVTPEYAGLPAEAFERIRDGMLSRGIAFKAVFLMRDPIERCWSAVRMYRRKGLPLPGVSDGLDDDRSVRCYCGTAHARQHGSYDRTVAALTRAFAPEELYFGFYETLFTPASVRDISAFLGIEPRPQFARERYNVSSKDQPLSCATRQAVADAYASTVRFCAERFPVTLTLWPTCELVAGAARRTAT